MQFKECDKCGQRGQFRSVAFPLEEGYAVGELCGDCRRLFDAYVKDFFRNEVRILAPSAKRAVR